MQHWDRIEAFVEVVRHESFAGAARNLGVSSSHVSRLVARLETQLGTQLLYRTTRRLRSPAMARSSYRASTAPSSSALRNPRRRVEERVLR